MEVYAKNKVFENNYYSVYNNGVLFSNGINGSYLTLKNKKGGVVVVAKYKNKYVLIKIERIFVGGKRMEFIRGFKEKKKKQLLMQR